MKTGISENDVLKSNQLNIAGIYGNQSDLSRILSQLNTGESIQLIIMDYIF